MHRSVMDVLWKARFLVWQRQAHVRGAMPQSLCAVSYHAGIGLSRKLEIICIVISNGRCHLRSAHRGAGLSAPPQVDQLVGGQDVGGAGTFRKGVGHTS
jgi:hypothetical protein